MNQLEKLFEDWNEALVAKDLDKASSIMNVIWVTFQTFVVNNLRPDLKEINYIKAPLTVDNGGKYLLSLIHVDGQKIQLEGSASMTISKQETV